MSRPRRQASLFHPEPDAGQSNGDGPFVTLPCSTILTPAQLATNPLAVIPISRPPSSNTIWRFAPNIPHPLISREYRKWIEANAKTVGCIGALGSNLAGQFPICVLLVVRGAVLRGRTAEERLCYLDPALDVDNLLKPAVDILKRAGVIPDDSIRYVRLAASLHLPSARRPRFDLLLLPGAYADTLLPDSWDSG